MIMTHIEIRIQEWRLKWHEDAHNQLAIFWLKSLRRDILEQFSEENWIRILKNSVLITWISVKNKQWSYFLRDYKCSRLGERYSTSLRVALEKREIYRQHHFGIPDHMIKFRSTSIFSIHLDEITLHSLAVNLRSNLFLFSFNCCNICKRTVICTFSGFFLM